MISCDEQQTHTAEWHFLKGKLAHMMSLFKLRQKFERNGSKNDHTKSPALTSKVYLECVLFLPLRKTLIDQTDGRQVWRSLSLWRMIVCVCGKNNSNRTSRKILSRHWNIHSLKSPTMHCENQGALMFFKNKPLIINQFNYILLDR